jgi:hypothetical protein
MSECNYHRVCYAHIKHIDKKYVGLNGVEMDNNLLVEEMIIYYAFGI